MEVEKISDRSGENIKETWEKIESVRTSLDITRIFPKLLQDDVKSSKIERQENRKPRMSEEIWQEKYIF